ncbi:hypothetical protein HDU96_006762 [Phlyctochytrium bullatum]|nr:hypothetical protein HDU96_006762 [Phlyctochytrium bullatum]
MSKSLMSAAAAAATSAGLLGGNSKTPEFKKDHKQQNAPQSQNQGQKHQTASTSSSTTELLVDEGYGGSLPNFAGDGQQQAQGGQRGSASSGSKSGNLNTTSRAQWDPSAKSPARRACLTGSPQLMSVTIALLITPTQMAV